MNISSSKKFLVLLILTLLLVSFCFAKRGGGGGGGGRSRSRSFRSSRSSFGKYRSNQNCAIVNGTKVCDNNSQSQPAPIALILLVFCIPFSFAFCCICFQEYKIRVYRRAKLDAIFKQFQVKSQQYPSSLNEQQRSSLLDYFMKRKYTIVVTVKNTSEKFFCQIKITDLTKQSQIKYRIKLSGTDSIGTSKFDGILIFQADGIGLKLSQVYDNRSKAGQTGRWHTILYQGFGNPNQINGEWSYLGFQNDDKYSGFWSMQQM